ncbi:MAG: 3-deoxy-D-manno-octulosonic acid transferase [Saprospiraceae bacterium]|nr:3-deoxy-D-manno-octulosonic acid transferase [Saprospiraceae bacterium]
MWIYRLLVSLYFSLISFASYFRKDALLWKKGRNQWKKKYVHLNPDHRESIWIHCSSLGEFEQGRPLIESIRKNHPQAFLWLSFYSPSGFEIRKNYDQVNVVSYFPSDTKSDVSAFLQMVRPKLVIFVKYDFWYETLHQLNLNKIPFVYISMHLRSDHILFRSFMNHFRKILLQGRHFFLQNNESSTLASRLGIEHYTVCGDTRLDRVLQIAKNPEISELVNHFCGSKKILVAGSVWEDDVALIASSWKNMNHNLWKLILAPHQPDEKHLAKIESQFPAATVRLSNLNLATDLPILIIDGIGQLSSIYAKASLAYVGGGFGKSIHNILEPAAHLKSVCFGPAHRKFPEAASMIHLGIGFEIQHPDSLTQLAQCAEQESWCTDKAVKLKNYLLEHSGATHCIYQKLVELQLL